MRRDNQDMTQKARSSFRRDPTARHLPHRHIGPPKKVIRNVNTAFPAYFADVGIPPRREQTIPDSPRHVLGAKPKPRGDFVTANQIQEFTNIHNAAQNKHFA
jgi:hypothetical protein